MSVYVFVCLPQGYLCNLIQYTALHQLCVSCMHVRTYVHAFVSFSVAVFSKCKMTPLALGWPSIGLLAMDKASWLYDYMHS